MYLAQFNYAKLLCDKDDPRVAEFFNRLDEINTLAEAAPGFIWRLQDESGDSLNINPYPDDLVIVNMSIWASIESLKDYTYYSNHIELFRKRREWFLKNDKPQLVLWWIDEDAPFPDANEGRKRLDFLTQNGASADAFTFKNPFDKPSKNSQ